MKKIFFIILLFFSYPNFANDIYDFEIEGASLGESALDYFSLEQIKSNKWDYYDDKKYVPVQIDNLSFFNTYDAVDFAYLREDDKYIIHSLSGVLIYENNIKDCYKQMDTIIDELKDNLNPIEFLDKETFSFEDGTDSKYTDAVFNFDSGVIVVACYDYANQESQDHLAVTISTHEFDEWLSEKAYN